MPSNAFSPTAPTVRVTVTVSSQSVPLGIGQAGGTVRVLNSGSNYAYVTFGAPGTVNAATGMPIAPGIIEVFGLGAGSGVNIIGTDGVVYFTPGEGN